ncbi:MAG: carboxypeptidase regulatory-like domain-containing protein [Pyrinomonadaceae bacterium]
MQSFRRIAQVMSVFVLALVCVLSAQAQVTTGNVRGVVTDPNGALVTGAKVTITKKSNNNSSTTQTSDSGQFEFNNLLVGDDYSVTVEAANFKSLTLTDVKVQLNQITDLPAQLTVGGVGETVIVTSGGTELVDTTTTTLSKSFSERQVVELAQTGFGGAFGGGVNNLALTAPNVSSSGGVGVGSGGSVGGQRPRNNNFMVDGVDNNDKSITGPQVYVSPENVQEFSLLQNQFSAEFARSNGGQFITVTKTGSNDFHGSVFGFYRNRFLNALDTRQKEEGFVRERDVPGTQFLPRLDFVRTGFNLGGPVILPKFGEGGPSTWRGKDKLFFFTAYERLHVGTAAVPAGITAFTAAGLAMVAAAPGVSPTNLNIYRQFVPIAATNNSGVVNFCSVQPNLNGICPGATLQVPIGTIELEPTPQFTKQNNFVLNFDFTQSSKTQHHFRFNLTNNSSLGIAGLQAGLPIFNDPVPVKQRLMSYTLIHTLTSNLTNETRIAYRRSDNSFPVTTSFRFPGLNDTTFPNIGLLDLGVDVGPNGNFPQTGIENNYQVVNNISWLRGNHSFKFGGDFRKIISPQTFTQRARGDYQYSEAQFYFYDLRPDFTAQRSVGDVVYYGDQKVLYAFVQDDWRVRPNLTLNLGVNYSYQQVPVGAKLQALNSISSVPGLIDFHAPIEQKKNFGPKVGFAWSPDYNSGLLGTLFGSGGKSSIRAGFSMAYDYIFDNLYILSLPPQAQQTIDVTVGGPLLYTPGFLAGGGIPNVLINAGNDPVAARAATSAFIDDQEVPYSLTWTTSFQRQFGTNWAFEARYLGTRGIHLLTQNRINRQATVSPEDGRPGLPTFLQRPSQAQIDGLTLTLDEINARSNFVPAFFNAGFTNPGSIVGFLSNGNSTYHGASAQLTRRFADGLQLTAAYTWSHLIDDTTAEVNSTVLSPRRVEDFQNLRRDRADSALDRRHRFVSSFIYELPWFRNHSSGFVRTVLGGFNFSGTFTAESGQKATVLSGIDSNGNGDAAADRAIRNPDGLTGTGSTVTALCRITGDCALPGAGPVVGYVADNPNAEYIRAGNGAVSNSARNTLQLPGINNLDFSIFKNFRFGETRRIQLRADFFNAFNHPQYIPGSPNDIQPVNTTAFGQVNTITAATLSLTNPALATFNRADRVFPSNPRVIQVGLRYNF